MALKQNSLERVREYFEELEDPRVGRAKRHELLDIVVIAVCGIICSADAWVDIEEFGKAKEEWFRTFLDLPNGIPSHDTFGRVFARLDPEQLQRCLVSWSAALRQASGGKLVALDGKTLRRSHDHARGKNALHMISAWSVDSHLVLGQQKVAGHSNEITAIPALLEMLSVEGCTVTIDAMGTQKAIAEQVQEGGGDYVFALKANQGALYEAVVDSFEQAERTHFDGVAHDRVETVNGGHGRIETRRCWTITDPEYLRYLNPGKEWSGLKSVGLVEAERPCGRSGEYGKTVLHLQPVGQSQRVQPSSERALGHREWPTLDPGRSLPTRR